MDNEKILKKQIIKSAESVKRKVKMIRDLKTNNEMVMESILKPITEPLKQMASNSSNEYNDITPKIKKQVGSSKKRRTNLNAASLFKNPRLSHDIEDHSSDSHSDNTNKTMFLKNRKSDVYFNEKEDDSVLSDGYKQESSSEYSDDTNEQNPNSSSLSFKSTESPRKSWSMSLELIEDIPFGVRRDREKLMMGTARVSVNEDTITIAGKTYKKTPGLIELLFTKTPELGIITEHDKQHYKTILVDTNAHRRNYDPTKPIKSNKGRKYTQIIKPLFIRLSKNCESTESVSHGSGLPVIKQLKQKVDYVYWDDPNELVDRLKLLIASRDAGNTGLDNEIISIIEELRESGIIH